MTAQIKCNIHVKNSMPMVAMEFQVMPPKGGREGFHFRVFFHLLWSYGCVNGASSEAFLFLGNHRSSIALHSLLLHVRE
jgi:hypothetical protein